MIGYNLFFDQNRIHDRWHAHYTDIAQVLFYHRDLSCPLCYPPGRNTAQFDNFWNWYSGEHPAVNYTAYTQQALEALDNSLTNQETWEAIYSIVFSIRYSAEPRPYTNIRQDLYNAAI